MTGERGRNATEVKEGEDEASMLKKVGRDTEEMGMGTSN
jgi:hypothetical protein